MTKGLAIVGNGKMGKLVDSLAHSFDFEVRARFAAHNNASAAGLTRESLRHVDVAIEFSTPESAPDNLLRLASLGVATVTGTTGWYDHLPAVRDAVLQANTSLVWGPNFSIGMNIFMQVVGQAAALFAKHPHYDAWGWEIHHAAKKDAPSGTLKKLAEEIMQASPMSVRASKEAVYRGLMEPSVEAALKAQNSYPAVAAMFRSEDLREGPRAFAEKRAAAFKHR